MITETRKGIPALAALTLFSVLSGEFWPNLLGVTGAIILWAALSALIALAVTRLGGWAKLRPSLLPKSLALFLLSGVLSVAWSSDRGMAAWSVAVLLALTLAGIFLATTFSWPTLLAMLGRSTRLIIGLSLAFELVTAIFVRQSIQPFAGLSDNSEISHSNLFTGDPILGIVGSADMLGAVAVLDLIVLALQRASGTVSRRRLLGWVILLAGTLILSGSWTAVAAFGVTCLSWGVLLVARGRDEGRRGPVAISAAVIAIAGVTALYLTPGHWPALPAGLAAMSPLGLVVLLGVVLSAKYRSWWLAADRQRDTGGAALPNSATTLVPFLLVVFATVYLVAGTSFGLTTVLTTGWLLLVLVTVKSKQDAHSVALPLAGVSGRYRDIPLPGFQHRARWS